MKKQHLVLAFCCLTLSLNFLQGQNIVPNYSFEDTVTCPSDAGFELYLATPWFSASTTTSPDLFNQCNGIDYTGVYGVPANAQGFQYASSGVGYAGIYVEAPQYRKYLEVKLDSALKSGDVYCLSYYVSLADTFEEAFGAFGVYFSNDSVIEGNYHALPYIPQVENLSSNFVTDKTNWTLITGQYTAIGGERFITIGNFNDDVNTQTIKATGGSEDYSYYYVDDVLLVDCTVAAGIAESNALVFEMYPNPVQDKVTIQLPVENRYTFCLTNIFGQQVLDKKQFIGTKTEIDVSELPKGVYFLEVANDLNKGVKKIIVQ